MTQENHSEGAPQSNEPHADSGDLRERVRKLQEKTAALDETLDRVTETVREAAGE